MTQEVRILPEMSVILPTTGSPHLLSIVQSFLAEDVSCEIIVIVDKPEAELAALETLAATDPRLRIMRNRNNIGLTRSLNIALAAARGAIIVRNDDDDLPAPQRLVKIRNFFTAHPDIDLVCSHAIGKDAESGQTWVIDGPADDAAIKAKLLERNFIVHSTLAFRREPVAAIGNYDETFRYAQDYDLYLRAIRAGLRFGCIPEPLVTRIYHAQSITVNRRKRQILFSFAARLIHLAHAPEPLNIWPTVLSYVKLLAIPDTLRKLRRRLGRGR